MKKFKHLDTQEILKLVGCPECKTCSCNFIEDSDFIFITMTELNLSFSIPERLTVWANCKKCNNVYAITYWNNSENPRITLTKVCTIEEFIKDLNNEYTSKGASSDICNWFPFKVENYKSQ